MDKGMMSKSLVDLGCQVFSPLSNSSPPPPKNKPIKTFAINETNSNSNNSPISEPANSPAEDNKKKKREKIEIRVCTNRTCRRQGSFDTLETLSGIAPPHVAVNPCGCLGRCGSGPNLVVLPQGFMVAHCGTPSKSAQLMVDITGNADGSDGGSDVARRSLDALALRKRAEMELERENFSEAEALFSQVIEATPIGGIHAAYKGRSAVRLASGNFSGALEDAKEALVLDPLYAEAYICQGDAYLALDQLEAAEESYHMAVQSNPAIRRSKSFKARIQNLEENLSSIAVR